jgi:hypothetical protein
VFEVDARCSACPEVLVALMSACVDSVSRILISSRSDKVAPAKELSVDVVRKGGLAPVSLSGAKDEITKL